MSRDANLTQEALGAENCSELWPQFLAIYKTVERNTPPSTGEMAAMGKLIEEMVNKGVLLSTEGCLPSTKGARVRRAGGKITVTDGPFTESKELIAGFALFQTKTKE